MAKQREDQIGTRLRSQNTKKCQKKCMHLVYFISVILFSSKHTLLLTDLGAFIYYVMRPDTKLELHKKELKKLELQKNEPSKLELHKLEPITKKNFMVLGMIEKN